MVNMWEDLDTKTLKAMREEECYGSLPVVESIISGVPMIAWPLYAEHKMNAALLAEELSVAWFFFFKIKLIYLYLKKEPQKFLTSYD